MEITNQTELLQELPATSRKLTAWHSGCNTPNGSGCAKLCSRFTCG